MAAPVCECERVLIDRSMQMSGQTEAENDHTHLELLLRLYLRIVAVLLLIEMTRIVSRTFVACEVRKNLPIARQVGVYAGPRQTCDSFMHGATRSKAERHRHTLLIRGQGLAIWCSVAIKLVGSLRIGAGFSSVTKCRLTQERLWT